MRRVLIFVLLILAFVSGRRLAQRLTPDGSWQPENLRAIRATAGSNLSALLLRRQATRCEIRLDLLDLPETPAYRLEIALNERRYTFSAAAPPPPRTRLSLDSTLDTLTVSLPDCPPTASLRVTLNGESLAATLNAAPPTAPLPLYFVFYNCFNPAATPAQILRRWDAAHSGPRGERHGLKNLLAAAEQNSIPLTLLDLKTPFALPALDALGALPQIRRMEAAGLLELPAAQFSPTDGDSLAVSRFAAQAFDLADNHTYFLLSAAPQIPTQPDLTRAGFPLATRELLYENLLAQQPLTLGGDFQKSTWGTGEYAAPALAWLAARPYFSAQTGGIALPRTAENPPAAPDEALLAQLAQRAPLTDPRLTAAYAATPVWAQAAAWRKNPQPGATCGGDWCWLTSAHFFAAIDLRGGKITHFFADGQQALAPTWQFFLGLSDASRWDFSQDLGADPGQIGGSFGDPDAPFRRYLAEKIGATALRLRAAGRAKTFTLTARGLAVEFHQPQQTLVTLSAPPLAVFSPGWAGRLRLAQEPERLGFGLENGPMAWILAPAGSILAVDSSLAALPLLASPENPNAELPPGAFLPFPLTVVRLKATPGAPIWLEPGK